MAHIQTYKEYTDIQNLQIVVHEGVKEWAVCGYDNDLQRISDFEDMAYGGGNIDSLVECMVEFAKNNSYFTEDWLYENRDNIIQYMAEQAKIEMPYIMTIEDD